MPRTNKPKSEEGELRETGTPIEEETIAEAFTALRAGAIGYGRVINAMESVFEELTVGKGGVRHAIEVPFEHQHMMTISRNLGSWHGLTYQASKKIFEASKARSIDNIRAKAELRGAINYLYGALVYLEIYGGEA